jgi:hypothetical protein
MPIDFPSSPAVGQLYSYSGVIYVYTAQGVWSAAGAVAPASDFGFRATKGSTDQTGIATTDTKITFTTEELDRGGYYDASNSRWTPPAGFVRVSARVMFGGGTAGNNYYLSIYKNGVISKNAFTCLGSSEAGFGGLQVDLDDYASGSDYYEVYLRSPQGGSQTVYAGAPTNVSWFQGHITGGRGPQGPIGTVPSGTRVLIQSQVISTAVASVDFTSGIDSTYDEYEITMSKFWLGSGSAVYLRVSGDNGATWKAGATDYQWAFGYAPTNGAGAFTGSPGTPQAQLSVGLSTSFFVQGVVRFFGPSVSGYQSMLFEMFGHHSTLSFTHHRGGAFYIGSAITWNGVRIFLSPGNIASGFFNLYGIKR